MTTYPLDDMTISQLFETLIWQACDYLNEEDDNPTPLDSLGYTRSDIPRDQQETLIEEFRSFCEANDADVREYMSTTGSTLDQVAHDFILTRNRHGAGFWDRGAGDVGERLSDMARPYGETDVYVGDDGSLNIC